ncbi:LysM peptidoglycan-binding domain-containing protein [Streptomyces sp. NBC_01619]|nr:LysM peptidoglycan-binding domain-containing protein [Streptomyces sp. NBC_01619]
MREIRPAESLWGIAERELGDGERWREIAALNEGRTMADGQVFKASTFLQPGWQLKMPDTPDAPGDVRALGDRAPAADENEHVVTVHSGDYLSKIAEEELGDGTAWPALFEASRGTAQPDGLPVISDPDVIYPGQQVTVPGAEPERDGQPQDSNQGDETGPAARRPLPRPRRHPTASRSRAMTRLMDRHPRRTGPRRPHPSRRFPAHRPVAPLCSPGRIRLLLRQRPPRHPGPPPASPPPPPPRQRRPSPPAPPPLRRPRPGGSMAPSRRCRTGPSNPPVSASPAVRP